MFRLAIRVEMRMGVKLILKLILRGKAPTRQRFNTVPKQQIKFWDSKSTNVLNMFQSDELDSFTIYPPS